MKLVITETIRDAISRMEDTSSLEVGEDYITHSSVVKIHKKLGISMRELLKNTEVFFDPKPQPRPKTKEFLELLERMKIQEQETEYQKLLHHDYEPGNEEDNITVGQAAKEVKEQLSTIVNIVISVASVAWALWYWTDSSMKSLSLASRTLISLFGGLVILIAEVVIYSRYKFKVQDARTVERSKREKTQIISSIEIYPEPTKEEKPNASKPKSLTIGKEKKNKNKGLRKRA
ncbi:vacuolar ATPase assembly integral membrane protein Vph2p [Trichomonascus vanleenenianus]|uniref:Vph2p n=1 Tax=Trichomonascus vanleenenianus TaxID=2268995 RepID=UPI003ECA5645